MFIRVPHGPGHGYRCYVAGRRLHHGVTGIALAVIGVALVVHDRKDARIFFARDRYLDTKAAGE